MKIKEIAKNIIHYLRLIGVIGLLKKMGVNRLRRKLGIEVHNVGRLFQLLDSNNINYVVLRWFESLDNIKNGEDIDILVSDDHYPYIRKYIKKSWPRKNYILIDVYPESDITGHVAYYPPKLAKRILNSRRKLDSGIWAPGIAEYFFSLSYHALFHKGFSSGLVSEHNTNNTGSLSSNTKNYQRYLSVLAEQANIQVNGNLTMEKLEVILGQNDWLPPLDLYFKRSSGNDWVACQVQKYIKPEWKKNKGYAVLILRENGISENIVNLLDELFIQNSITEIRRVILTVEQSKEFSNKTRGSDWGMQNENKAKGGWPKLVIIVFNKNISSAEQYVDERPPTGVVEYQWLQNIKSTVRQEYIKHNNNGIYCHILHTSDNGVEAAYYISVLDSILNR